MRSNNNYEKGHSSPMMSLAIMMIVGILGYLAFDSMNPGDPSSTSLHDMLTTWLGWPWWAKGLSIIGPIAMLVISSRMDSSSGFGKLPPDE